MRTATAYLRGGYLLLHANSRTVEAVWIVAEPLLRLDAGSSHSECGEAVRSVLAASKERVPHPQPGEWQAVVEPLLTMAGVKSWRGFSKGATCVELEEDADRITMTPTRNLGPKEGFEGDPSRRLAVRASDGAEAIGAGLREAFRRAE